MRLPRPAAVPAVALALALAVGSGAALLLALDPSVLGGSATGNEQPIDDNHPGPGLEVPASSQDTPSPLDGGRSGTAPGGEPVGPADLDRDHAERGDRDHREHRDHRDHAEHRDREHR